VCLFLSPSPSLSLCILPYVAFLGYAARMLASEAQYRILSLLSLAMRAGSGICRSWPLLSSKGCWFCWLNCFLPRLFHCISPSFLSRLFESSPLPWSRLIRYRLPDKEPVIAFCCLTQFKPLKSADTRNRLINDVLCEYRTSTPSSVPKTPLSKPQAIRLAAPKTAPWPTYSIEDFYTRPALQ